ncbi:hypothetical protein ACWEKM_33480 [Streptomyces sp. NPDC004752]
MITGQQVPSLRTAARRGAWPPTAQERCEVGDLLTQQTGALLPAWIDEALTADLPALTGFARGLTGDLDTVTAGLTLR